MFLRVHRTDPRAELPKFAYPGDAGMDLMVVGPPTDDTGPVYWLIKPGEAMDLPTGLRIELPVGYWARITGRSSTMRKRGLLINEGIIDNGYRGELFAYARNLTDSDVLVSHGEHLAQLIIHEVVTPQIVDSPEGLAGSPRGARGFGSSGS